ncbi:hypothetical protein [Kibdelosporangium philippinense]|uniref:hypothetical protein n=1 Tax=Kibdelosporangium philippinense TaxID=211113 RepID=UPI00361F1E5C
MRLSLNKRLFNDSDPAIQIPGLGLEHAESSVEPSGLIKVANRGQPIDPQRQQRKHVRPGEHDKPPGRQLGSEFAWQQRIQVRGQRLQQPMPSKKIVLLIRQVRLVSQLDRIRSHQRRRSRRIRDSQRNMHGIGGFQNGPNPRRLPRAPIPRVELQSQFLSPGSQVRAQLSSCRPGNLATRHRHRELNPIGIQAAQQQSRTGREVHRPDRTGRVMDLVEVSTQQLHATRHVPGHGAELQVQPHVTLARLLTRLPIRHQMRVPSPFNLAKSCQRGQQSRQNTLWLRAAREPPSQCGFRMA